MAGPEEPVLVAGDAADRRRGFSTGVRDVGGRTVPASSWIGPQKPFSPIDASASVVRERLSSWVDPERVFDALLARESWAYWLDAGIHARDGISYLGAASPSESSLLVRGARLFRMNGGGHEREVGGDVFDVVSARLSEAGTDVDGSPLGWVGWLGYELGARALGVPASESRHPDAALLAADRVIAFDHAAREISLWYRASDDETAWAAETAQRIAEVGRVPGADRPTRQVRGLPVPTAGPLWRHGDDAYLDMIAECQASITAGDAYQLCLTDTVEVPTSADPFDVYRTLRRGSRARYGGFIRAGDTALLSASPELFLRVDEESAMTRPVKGTKRRGSDAAEDLLLRDELLNDEKERAENLMIVDLMRNDLGRVAAVGGVSVTELLEVETHEHVHQLVSTVTARLAEGRTAVDVVRASFPAGSMTGAPKLSAMGILHRLEGGPRGVYSGSFGRIGLDGSLELAMVIRSIIMDPRGATIGTGGGITALSVPGRELEEIKLKAEALLRTLGA